MLSAARSSFIRPTRLRAFSSAIQKAYDQHYIAGDPPRDQDEARARARAGRQVFTGSGAGGALSPLMMVLVHHGLRHNGIALPAGRVVLNRATTRMLYGGPVAEAAWQRVFAEARNLDSWAACRAMAVQAVATVPARRVDAILNGMSGGGYIIAIKN